MNDQQQPQLQGQANVGKACNNCRKAHIACDDTERPCRRCVRLEIGHLCADVPVRKRGRPSWRSAQQQRQQQSESSGDARNPRAELSSSLPSPSSSSSSPSSSSPLYCSPPANDGARVARPAKKSRRSPCSHEDSLVPSDSPTTTTTRTNSTRTMMTSTDLTSAAATAEAVDQLQRLASHLSQLVADLSREVNGLKENNFDLERRLIQLEDARYHQQQPTSWYDAPTPPLPLSLPPASVSDDGGSSWAAHPRVSSAFPPPPPSQHHLPPQVPPFSPYTWF